MSSDLYNGSSELRRYLTDARDLIKDKGWVQYKMGSRNEGYCLIGAIIASTPSSREATRAIGSLGRGADEYSVAMWNDIPGRTREEVLELLELAIEAA